MSADTVWFYEKNGERTGPVTDAELLERLAAGEISAATLVWREGMADWAPLSQTELAEGGGIPRTPPAMPALSALPPAMPKLAEPFVPREIHLNPNFRISIRSSFARAWTLLTGRFWPFIGCYLLMMVLLSVANQLIAPVFFLMFPIVAGFSWYTLRVMRGQNAEFDHLFEGFRRQFGPLAILNLIIAGIATVVTLLFAGVAVFGFAFAASALQPSEQDPVMMTLFIVVGVIAYLALFVPMAIFGFLGSFTVFLIIDGGLDAGPALSLAWTAVKQNLGKALLFIIVSSVLSMIGVFALFIGVIVTSAWATIAMAYVYEDAFGGDAEPAQLRIA